MSKFQEIVDKYSNILKEETPIQKISAGQQTDPSTGQPVAPQQAAQQPTQPAQPTQQATGVDYSALDTAKGQDIRDSTKS